MVKTILFILLLLCIAAAIVLLVLRTHRRLQCTLSITAKFHQGEGLFPDTYWFYAYEGKTYRAPIHQSGSIVDEIEVSIDPDAPEVCYYFGDISFWICFLPPVIGACVIIFCL